MGLVPWHPFRELDRMPNTMERLLAEPFANLGNLPELWQLRFPVEVIEQGNDVLVRKREVDEDREGVRHTERFYGTFSRTVAFPVPLESTKARATFRHGLLEVRAPRRNPNEGRDGRKLNIELQ